MTGRLDVDQPWPFLISEEEVSFDIPGCTSEADGSAGSHISGRVENYSSLGGLIQRGCSGGRGMWYVYESLPVDWTGVSAVALNWFMGIAEGHDARTIWPWADHFALQLPASCKVVACNCTNRFDKFKRGAFVVEDVNGSWIEQSYAGNEVFEVFRLINRLYH